MSKILKNNTASPITVTDVGSVVIPASPGSYTIPPQDYLLWAASSDVIGFVSTPVATPDVTVNDGSVDLNISDGIDLIKGLFPRLFVFDPIVENIVTDATPNTETSHTLPTGTKRFLLKARTSAILKLAYAVGTSGTTFATIERRNFYLEDRIGSGTTTLYLQSPTASVTVEIISWS